MIFNSNTNTQNVGTQIQIRRSMLSMGTIEVRKHIRRPIIGQGSNSIKHIIGPTDSEGPIQRKTSFDFGGSTQGRQIYFMT